MASFNFKMIMGLDTSQFSKAIRKTEVEFNRFVSTLTTMAGALGAGLGLGAIVSKLKDTATDLSVANATLENTFSNAYDKYSENMARLEDELEKGKISIDSYNQKIVEARGVFDQYGDSVEFLDRLSREYKQEIISLTQSFANFHAAADQMNISFETQKKLYEAMTRAATYFHLSSERTHDAMVALEQMMSKGKVTAEELRRQLGNNLPGAFGLMAKAVGMTTAELEKAMKAGQVLADENTMGKFAEQLNKLTQNIDLNSLQLSMNEVSNAWTRLVQATNVENALVGALKAVANWLDKLRANINSLKTDVKAIASALVISKIVKSISGVIVKTKEWKDEFRAIHHAEKVLAEPLKHSQKAIDRAKAKTTTWQYAVHGVRGAFKGLVATMKGFALSNIFTAAILAVSELVGHMAQFIKAGKDAKNTYNNLFNDINKEIDSALANTRNSDGVLNISSDLIALKELKAGTKEYGEMVKGIYSKMDMSSPIDAMHTSWETVNGDVKKYLEHLDDVALMEVANAQIANLSAKQMQLQRDIENYNPNIWQKMWDSILLNARASNALGLANPLGLLAGQSTGIEALNNELQGTVKAIEEIKAAREQLYQKIQQWNKDNPTSDYTPDGGNGGGKGWEESKDKFAKIVQKYKEDTTELNNQLRHGAIGVDEYAKAMDKIVLAAGKGIQGFKDYTAEAKKYGKEVEALTDEIIKKYPAAHAREFIEGLEKGNTAKEIENAINKEVEEFQKALEKELNERLELDIKTKIKVDAGDTPKIDLNKDRGLFDYKNTGKKLYEDDYKASQSFVSELEKEISLYEKKQEELGSLGAEAEGYLQMLKEQLAQAAAATDNFKAAMDFSEISADIEKYQKELLALGATGIKDLATSMDRIVKGAESLKSVFEDDESSGWDKFMAVFNEIVQIVDTMVGIYQTVTKFTEKNTALEGAKLALQTAGEAAIAAQLVTEKALTKELKQQAAAQAAISAMELPFPENIGALAANMAAIEAAFAASKAFENGGVIDYGSASGDRTLARVNKGEMVLNKGQQATLFNALQSGSFGTGNVQFKIKGADLVGTIENYQSRMRG